MAQEQAYESQDFILSEQNAFNQTRNLQKVYAYYRLILSLVLVLLYFGEYATKVSSQYNPDLYLWVSLGYFCLNLLTLIYIARAEQAIDDRRLFINTMIDIIALIMITHASGGIQSGMGNLLVISVAAASIFFVGSIPTLVAATATISLFVEHIYVNIIDPTRATDFLGIALLGILFFTTSYVMQFLAQRIRNSQSMAESKAADAASMQRLNNLIVQRMRTGILVTNNDGDIRMMNKSAGDVLEIPSALQQKHIGGELQSRLVQWQKSPQMRPTPFRTRESGPEIQANFMPLERSGTGNLETLIFLEDTSTVAQQAQQMKLASLGRLTASIAHEIRNPLGAISHAAQLMEESDQLPPADLKLAGIIQKHSVRMNQIIENVLRLSRRSPAKPEKLRIKPWLENFCQDFDSTDTPGARIEVVVDPEDTVVSIDPSQLGQVITNLCHNGLRYSKQETGKATMLLYAYTDRVSNMPFLDVIDDGPGIDEASREKIFEPFYTTEGSGTGLGLYISREICEANQTRLDYIINDKGKSCFRLSFSHPDKIIASDSIDPTMNV